MHDTLEQLFVNAPQKNRERLRQVRGIHIDSQLYYSHRDMCCQQVVIRMAREEDHDDLAEIFNQQSEVQTDKFGEFFIADMIAMQNQTRYLFTSESNQAKHQGPHQPGQGARRRGGPQGRRHNVRA